jgi:DNA polymerase-3 subunit delta
MTPDQFLHSIRRQPPSPVYLFIGPERHARDLCRRALIERVLPPEERESGFNRHDLKETSLAAAVDDARCLSLFTPARVIWVSSAEEADEPGDMLANYVADPSPGVALVFDSSRYGLDGEDKTKSERVKKTFAAVPHHVEFAPYTPAAARKLAEESAREMGLKIAPAALDLLTEALAADVVRIEGELEKLRLYAGAEREVTVDDVLLMAPDARSASIFTLVNALARGDRIAALEVLDTLIREGEYLPLALAFLETQFRLALVAKEAGLRTSPQIQAHFAKLGVAMWRSRADQVQSTISAFSSERIRKAIGRIYAADKGLRDTRPDDRVVMEEFVLALTE